jgi:hypothetical protein
MRIRLAVLAALLSVAALPASAAFDTDGWTWQRPVTVPDDGSGYVRLRVPLEVFDTSQASLADLRILDKAGELVPYLIHWTEAPDSTGPDWDPVSLLNPVFQPGQYTRVTADFGASVAKNRIRIDTSGDNFRRRVLVEGSADGQSWDILLEDGWLFHVPLPSQDYRVDELALPLNDFRYLRLTVFNMPDDPRRIEIRSVETARWEVPEVPLVYVDVKLASHTFRDEKERVSIHELDLGYRNVPVAALHARDAGKFYYRAYDLTGRNGEKETVRRPGESGWSTVEREAPWEPIAQGVLYRIQHEDKVSESSTIHVPYGAHRYLRLRIFEQDNPPLTLDTITVQRREASLVFEARPDEAYTLVGGNPEARPPSFDLARALAGLEKRELPEAGLDEARPLEPSPRSVPWRERYSLLLWAALILAVATAVLLIARNLARLKEA